MLWQRNLPLTSSHCRVGLPCYLLSAFFQGFSVAVFCILILCLLEGITRSLYYIFSNSLISSTWGESAAHQSWTFLKVVLTLFQKRGYRKSLLTIFVLPPDKYNSWKVWVINATWPSAALVITCLCFLAMLRCNNPTTVPL